MNVWDEGFEVPCNNSYLLSPSFHSSPPPSLPSLPLFLHLPFFLNHSLSLLPHVQYFALFPLFRSLSSPSLNHVVHCTLLRVQYFTLFSLIRSLGVIHKGSTKHTSQLPTATEVWAGASGPQDEGSKRNQQPAVERRFHGEGTTVKDKKTLPPKHMEKETSTNTNGTLYG